MLRLSAVAVLLHSAWAQTVCKDDANFLPDKPFLSPYGSSETCGYWRDLLFKPLRDTHEKCWEKVTVFVDGVPGNVSMPAMEYQEYMAQLDNGLGAGCCGDSWEIGCAAFRDDIPDAPCAEGWVEDGGRCYPCYGRMVDGLCGGCWGADADGCTQEQCVPELGLWDEGEERCWTCNEWSVKGCGENHCADKGGNWNHRNQRCMECRPEWGDFMGCNEQQCLKIEGIYRKSEEFCSVCWPHLDWGLEGCNRQQCQDAMANRTDLNWNCWGDGPDDCRCQLCSVETSDFAHHSFCREDQCHPTPDAPDVKWTNMGCERCFRDANDDHDSNGCDDPKSCNAIEGFSWRDGCDPSSEQCCDVCFPDHAGGCHDHDSCEEYGGYWCDTYCAGGEEDCSGHAPSPPGRCTTVSRAKTELAESMGYTPRYC